MLSFRKNNEPIQEKTYGQTEEQTEGASKGWMEGQTHPILQDPSD